MKSFLQNIWKGGRVLLSIAIGIASALVAVRGIKGLLPTLREGLFEGSLPALLLGVLGIAALTYIVLGMLRLMLYAAPERMEQALCDRLVTLACLVFAGCLLGGMATGIYMLTMIHRAGGSAASAAVLRFIGLAAVFILPEKAFMNFTERHMVRAGTPPKLHRRHARSYDGTACGYSSNYAQQNVMTPQHNDMDAWTQQQCTDAESTDAFTRQQLADMQEDACRLFQSSADESWRCNQAASDSFMQNANDFAQSMNNFGF